jgi:hypothetical protein
MTMMTCVSVIFCLLSLMAGRGDDGCADAQLAFSAALGEFNDTSDNLSSMENYIISDQFNPDTDGWMIASAVDMTNELIGLQAECDQDLYRVRAACY